MIPIYFLLSRLSPFYYVVMGYSYFIMNDVALAEDFFKAAQRYSPEMIIIHLGLGQIYQKTGRDDLAFAEFREIININPEHIWALRDSALVYLAAGDTARSAEYIKKARTLAGDDAQFKWLDRRIHLHHTLHRLKTLLSKRFF